MTPDPSVRWRRSSYSNGMGGECVEVSTDVAVVAVRDSKAPLGPQITMSPPAWKIFAGAVRSASLG
ncbi:DUF397 domain-containing protein [Streptomyces sp. NPDC041068]|uniref:DUF397 domain-containing protein n=1 Tax=Streptomyces sp. NPDC041068 TaxID=3155130 RepID=UPI0033D89669